MNPFMQSIIGFLSLIQPSPELFSDWRSTLTFDRVLVAGSLVSSIIWWRYQRSYCIELHGKYSKLADEHAALAHRCVLLESSFKSLQKTGVEALTAQNGTIEALSKSFHKQLAAVNRSVKQNTDLTTLLTSSAAKHEQELSLLMQIREQLLKIARNQDAQIVELRGQIQAIAGPNAPTRVMPEQQKSPQKKPSASDGQNVYSGHFEQDSKTSELLSKLGRPSTFTPSPFPLGLKQTPVTFSGSNTLNFFQNSPNYSSTN